MKNHTHKETEFINWNSPVPLNYRVAMDFGVFIVVIFLAFCLLFVAEGETLPPSPKENCTYLVTIETTCTKGAETTNRVAIRFGDLKPNDVLVQRLNSRHLRRLEPIDPQVLDDVPTKPFQACVVDQFQVTGRCVESPVCYLYLKLVGHDDWRPGFAQVLPLDLDETHFRSEYFYFRRYLPRNVWHGIDLCHKEVTPFGIKSKRKNFHYS